jgi:glycosyltransferase involved in cell wall biosynthesis
MRPDIAILVLSRKAFFREHYFIHRLMEEWAAHGIEVGVFDDPRKVEGARVVLSHVDATLVPATHRVQATGQRPVLNGRAVDISKRAISRYLVTKDGGHDGPVILKTNLNCGGIPELLHGRPGSVMGRLTTHAMRKLPWILSGVLEPNDYKVYPNVASVPWPVWWNRRFVVERFLPERDGDLYCLRQYLFFGDAEINTLLLSDSPVVKAKSVLERRPVPEVPEALREIRRTLGFDYGRFDYVMNGDEVVVFDVNRTPAYHPARLSVPYKSMAEHLAKGLAGILERARTPGPGAEPGIPTVVLPPRLAPALPRPAGATAPSALRRDPPRAADGISVIMPAYQAREFIGEAIESILGQTFRNFELIVSDDGSSDGTAEIAEAYAARDPRVRLLRQAHCGVSAAGNACLEAARFDWVARMDADDVSLPHRLERLAAASAREPEVVLWGGLATHVDRHGRSLREVRIGPDSHARYLEMLATGKVIYVCGPTSMMRRDLALELGGYDVSLEASVDVELMDRMAKYGPVRVLPEVLTLYRLHGTSISSSRVAAQHRGFRYVRERNLAFLQGRYLGYEEFLRERSTRPVHRRVLDRFAELGRLHYRNAVIHHAEGRTLPALASACLALTLDPTHAAGRLNARLRGSGKAAGFGPHQPAASKDAHLIVSPNLGAMPVRDRL